MKHPNHPRRIFIRSAGALIFPLATPLAWAYPDRPVRIVVPFAPGAGTDAMGRLLAQKLSDALGGSFVVENRTGASGAIGTQFVAQSPPDGHTLLLIAAPFTTVPAVLATAGYDPVASFSPVSMIAEGPLVWACTKDLPAANLAELVELAKARPGQLNFGSAGAGGINHLMLEHFKALTGTDITHVPYRGIGPAVLDMVAGQIQIVTGTIPALAPFIRDGRIRALAVSTPQRSSALPQVPGLAETAMEALTALNYFGLVAPRGTPNVALRRINGALPGILADNDVQNRFRSDALEPAALGPSRLADFLARDFAAWRDIVARQKIRVEQI